MVLKFSAGFVYATGGVPEKVSVHVAEHADVLFAARCIRPQRVPETGFELAPLMRAESVVGPIEDSAVIDNAQVDTVDAGVERFSNPVIPELNGVYNFSRCSARRSGLTSTTSSTLSR